MVIALLVDEEHGDGREEASWWLTLFRKKTINLDSIAGQDGRYRRWDTPIRGIPIINQNYS